MKKILTIALISAGCFAGAVQAADEVRFMGAVTAVTCDLTPDAGNGPTDIVMLGNADVNSPGTDKEFALKPGNSPACQSIDDAKVHDITWDSASFTAQGVGNANGTATGAWMSFASVNSDGGPVDIKYNSKTAGFKGSDLKADGAKFKVKLNGGPVPGTYTSVAKFVVAYK